MSLPWKRLFPLVAVSILLFGASALPLPHAMSSSVLFFAFLFTLLFLTTHNSSARFPLFLTLISLQSLLQTAWYYANGTLNRQSDLITLGITLFAAALLFYPTQPHEEELPTADIPGNTWRWFWRISSCALTALGTGFILRHAVAVATTEALRSPWPLFPQGTFLAYALIGCGLWLAARRTSPRWTAFLQCMALASIIFIPLFVYKLGFGFDGFLHQASEEILLTTGTLSPKPPYYIGQYVFVTWLARLLDLSVRTIDGALVPLLTVLVPSIILLSWKRLRVSAWTYAGLPFLFPLALFITTTPQSLAYLAGVVALALCLSDVSHRERHIASICMACWSVAIHPLAGLPFLGAVLALLWTHYRPIERGYQLVRWLLLVGTGLAVPCAFVLHQLRTGALTRWDIGQLCTLAFYQDLFVSLIPSPASPLSLWAGWAVFVEALFTPTLFLLSLYAMYKDDANRPRWRTCILLAIICASAGFALQRIAVFSFLISYERTSYADRLFLVSTLILFLPALRGFEELFSRLTTKTRLIQASVFLFLLAWFGAHLYLALPRHDAAVIGHGWSVGQADIDAVQWIERDAGNEPYIVLANQSVSAAAIQSQGFKRYVNDVFYYPIPTGGPLYELFLEAMGPTVSTSTIQRAGALGKSTRVYVVLNAYWWEAEQVHERLTALAETTRSLREEKVRIYRFSTHSVKP